MAPVPHVRVPASSWDAYPVFQGFLVDGRTDKCTCSFLISPLGRERFFRFLQEAIDRLSLLSMFYIFFNGIGSAIVIVRSLWCSNEAMPDDFDRCAFLKFPRTPCRG